MCCSSQSDKPDPSSVRYLRVGEYRQYCRGLHCLNDMFSGCAGDSERRAWQPRASARLQQVSMICCRRATPGDNQRFYNASEELRTTLCRFSSTGQRQPVISVRC
ncbi:TPA: hypothetical protein G9F27_005681 [Salmonella enterica]|uniref:Uncharacterized protein n=1 Tax=Salmonella enterica TaxID=28901 RepID=A0A743SSV3_SALER|nr:hypothetical protein [Salmonella enterica]